MAKVSFWYTVNMYGIYTVSAVYKHVRHEFLSTFKFAANSLKLIFYRQTIKGNTRKTKTK